jgi:hypothetical protein
MIGSILYYLYKKNKKDSGSEFNPAPAILISSGALLIINNFK